MGEWKAPASKRTIVAKKGTKQGMFKLGLIPHKDSKCAGAGIEATMQEQNKSSVKIKRPEGIYEITYVIQWKSQLKTKEHAKKPLPEKCKMDTVVEFTEVRVFVDKIKLPEDHTLQSEISVNLVQNSGKGKDLVPEISLYVDIWTGHWLTGSWNKMLKQVYFSGDKKNKMRIYP